MVHKTRWGVSNKATHTLLHSTYAVQVVARSTICFYRTRAIEKETAAADKTLYYSSPAAAAAACSQHTETSERARAQQKRIRIEEYNPIDYFHQQKRKEEEGNTNQKQQQQ